MRLDILKKRSLALSGIALISGLFFYLLPQKNNEITAVPTQYISGFSKNTKMHIDYFDGQTLISDAFILNNTNTETKKFPPSIKPGKKYQIRYNIEQKNNKYIDIELQINKARSSVIATINTDQPQSPVSLNIDDHHYVQNVPTDWAGNIELVLENIEFSKKSKICLSLDNLSKMICHANATKKAVV